MRWNARDKRKGLLRLTLRDTFNFQPFPVKLVIGFALGFGMEHGDVGIMEQLFVVVGLVRINGNTDGR